MVNIVKGEKETVKDYLMLPKVKKSLHCLQDAQ